MDQKKTTQDSYQATAETFTKNVADLAPQESIEKFIKLLPTNPKIIDIGCASGRDAKIFSSLGANVVGIDFSSNLIDIAKKNAPEASFQVMDIETMNFPNGSFDGAWAGMSLLHIPKKSILKVLSNIHQLLKPKGIFYLTVKKGKGEILEKDFRYVEGNFEKFWAFYEEDEFKNLLIKAKFKLVEFAHVEKKHEYTTHHTTLRAFCQK